MADPYAIFAVLYAVGLLILSTVLNAAIFYVFVFKLKRSSELPQLFIISISILDILQASTGLASEISIFHRVFPLRNIRGCVEAAFLTFFTTVVRIIHMVVISLLRYFAFKNPVSYFNYCKRLWQRFALLFFCYLYGFLWAFLPITGWSNYEDDLDKRRCSLDWKLIHSSSLTYLMFVLVFCYILPGALLLWTLKKTNAAVAQNEENIFRKNCFNQQTEILAKVYLNIFSCFTIGCFVTWTPYIFVCVIAIFGVAVPPFLFHLAALFASLSSIIGAFVNCYFNKSFQSQLLHMGVFRWFQGNTISSEIGSSNQPKTDLEPHTSA